MSEETKTSQEQLPNPPAVLPDLKEKPFSLRIVEEYLNQADNALTKLEGAIANLKAGLKQRELETVAVNAQKDLLLDLQKKIIKENSK